MLPTKNYVDRPKTKSFTTFELLTIFGPFTTFGQFTTFGLLTIFGSFTIFGQFTTFELVTMLAIILYTPIIKTNLVKLIRSIFCYFYLQYILIRKHIVLTN
jgi:hypothetical protein